MGTRTVMFVLGLVAVLGGETLAASEKSDAKAAFNEGIALFKAESYEAAATAFRKANALNPNWKLQYNIGQSEAASKRYGLALEAFELYLAEGGDDVPRDRQDEVIGEVKRLRELVGTLEVRAPAGATVFVNGVDRGRTPLEGPIPIRAGIGNEVRVEKDGQSLLERSVRVGGGKSLVVDTDDREEPPALEAEPGDAEEEPEAGDGAPADGENEKLKIAGWSMLGGGAALLIAGAVTGGLTAAKAGDLEDRCPDKQCPDESDEDLKSSGENLALTTDILLPVGGVVAVTGAILLIVGYKSKESESGESARLTPVFNRGFNGLVLSGSF